MEPEWLKLENGHRRHEAVLRKQSLLRPFGDATKRRRIQQKMTQEDLGRRAGITRANISLIETGKFNPTLVKMLAIARALEIQLSELMIDSAM